jgi:uncharacterized protein YutE (UPF0331/DUF86 family)
MMPERISKRVVADRLAWIDKMLGTIRALPLSDRNVFFSDERNIATAESCLRRALEALFDLGRHLLAKGFAQASGEYKEVASGLKEHGLLAEQEADLMRQLAGYRNRLVHFYHEIPDNELYEICRAQLSDIETLSGALRKWLAAHPESLDETL